MHIEFFIEDMSGEIMLQKLLPRILEDHVTYRTRKYSGIGHIPKDLKESSTVKSKKLLNNLPGLLNGFGKTFQSYGKDYPAVLFVVMDLDKNNFKSFRNDLLEVLDSCSIKPTTYFCIAIEEGEAWFLGDTNAIKKAYPSAKETTLQSYHPDSICGTWELLADAIYPKGSIGLKSQGSQVVGITKCEWAEKITPHMDPNNNSSPSFNYFYKKLLSVV